ncbi:MAG TPA: DUF167 domain-containing protein [Acidobacteriaceae bacterium]|nr:DUF167 domain-containing protein [Acidobacteriaceae bacterium]
MMIRPTPDGCTLSVRVHPGAKRNAITGTHDAALKISLTTPPTDGRANQALIAFLAERLNIPRASIQLISGATSRSKTLHLTGIPAAEAESRLLIDLA